MSSNNISFLPSCDLPHQRGLNDLYRLLVSICLELENSSNSRDYILKNSSLEFFLGLTTSGSLRASSVSGLKIGSALLDRAQGGNMIIDCR
jgi:hypothetical protein